MNRIERLLRRTYEHTFQSQHKFPMAALLADGPRVLSLGVNQIKEHPLQQKRKNSRGFLYGRGQPHAELDCLIRAYYPHIAGSVMYVARRKKNLDIGLAKPCPACQELLVKYGIRRVYYTIDHPLLEKGKWYERLDL